MPLEARMYGIFAGFLLTWAVAFWLRRGRAALMPPPWLLFTFVAFIVVMGFDGLNATLYDINLMGLPVPYLYEPRLDLRLATGLLSGIGVGGIILPVVNYSLWRDARAQSIFASGRELVVLLIPNAILFVLVASQSGLFLYPTSLIGVLGVLALMAALNIVMVVSIVKREGAASNWRETLNPIAAAILLTTLELGALSAVRYAIFGTSVIP